MLIDPVGTVSYLGTQSMVHSGHSLLSYAHCFYWFPLAQHGYLAGSMSKSRLPRGKAKFFPSSSYFMSYSFHQVDQGTFFWSLLVKLDLNCLVHLWMFCFGCPIVHSEVRDAFLLRFDCWQCLKFELILLWLLCFWLISDYLILKATAISRDPDWLFAFVPFVWNCLVWSWLGRAI